MIDWRRKRVMPPANIMPPPVMFPLTVLPGDERLVLIVRKGANLGAIGRHHYLPDRWEVRTHGRSDTWTHMHGRHGYAPLDIVNIEGDGPLFWMEIRAGQVVVSGL